MNYNCSADDILYTEAVGQHRHHGMTPVSEQRRQIPGVSGMQAFSRIIMRQRTRERIPLCRFLTGGAFVYMKTEYASCTLPGSEGQTRNIGCHQHTLPGLIKQNAPSQ